MNRSQSVIALVAGMTLAMAAQADPINPTIRAAVNQISLGGGVVTQDYVEHDSTNTVPTSYLDKESGTIGALAFNTGWVSPAGFYADVHFLYALGQTDYEGYLQSMANPSNFTPYETETDNDLLDVRGNLGYLFDIHGDIALGPILEVGYTYWQREITGPYGSRTEYTSFRYGGGLKALYAATGRLVLSLTGIYGQQISHVNSRFMDASLGSSPYWRVAVGVDYRLTDRWHVGLHVAHINYEFEQSDVSASGFVEPPSETTHNRVIVSVGLGF